MATGGDPGGEGGLPPLLGRMWGKEPPSRRGPRPSLDLGRIAAAAVEIADAEGLGAVSMSAVAARLGVATMSLYRYVSSKDELLTAMVDAAADPPPEIGERGWREYLAIWTRAQRDALVARPWLLAISRHSPPLGPRTLRWLDRVLAALSGTALAEGEKIGIATTLNGYAFSHASLVVTLSAGSAEGGVRPAGATQYGELLAALIDAERYPALSAAVSAQAFAGGEGWVDDADFRFGLDLLLDGIDALLTRRASAR